MKRSPIQSLEDLKREKHKLQIQAEASRQLCQERLQALRKTSLQWVASRLLLPLVATRALKWGAEQLHSNGRQDEDFSESSQRIQSIFLKWLPLGLNVLSSFLLEQKDAHETTDVSTNHHG